MRVVASCQDQVMLCRVTYQVPGGGRGDGGRRIDRQGLDGGRDPTVGFRILVKKGLIF